MLKNVVFLLISVLASLFSTAQSADSVLKKLYAEYREEKIHLHLDKDTYYPGETIWYKAYLFSGDFPSTISGVLYADLLDTDGIVLQHQILPVGRSTTSGSFILPSTVGKKVTIRCYTKWMLNFDKELIYERAISIQSNNKNTPANTDNKQAANYRVSFFPESGDLLESIPSRLAFKATDQYDRPVAVSGVITNTKDQSTISFQTSHDGMGIVEITPTPNAEYKASWKTGDKSSETKLPVAKKKGITLEVKEAGNDFLYTLNTSDSEPVSPFVYIIGQMNQQLVYRAKIPITQNDIKSGRIATKNMGSGVLQLTVFTDNWQPIAERLVFAHLNKVSFPVNIAWKEVGKNPRAKNTIAIDIPDTLASTLSVSITATDQQETPINNIYSDILLHADLRGYIHNPAYYFSGADSTNQYLDLVMMTHGWRRFKWTDAMAGKFASIKYQPETSINVDGKVKGLSKSEWQERDLTGMLQFNGGTKYFMTSKFDEEGRFNFSNMLFFDSAKLYYQLNDDKKGNLTKKASFNSSTSILDKPFTLTPREQWLNIMPNDPILFALNEQSNKAIDSSRAKELEGVTVKSKVISKADSLNAAYTSGAFESNAQAKVFIPEDDPAALSSLTLFDYLQSRVSGMTINPLADLDPIVWRGYATALFVDEISQRVMDPSSGTNGGISLSGSGMAEDATMMKSIPMSDIALIKIFPPPFVGAAGNAPGGVLAVYRKKQGGKLMNTPKDFITVVGFTAIKEFYSPVYAQDAVQLQPDYRSTLYWNPFLITDKNHRQLEFSFYNNDKPGKMKMVLEGCNEDGRLIRIEKIIQ